MFTARLAQPKTLCSPCIPARTFAVPRAGPGTNGVGAGEQAKRAPSKNINVISPVSQCVSPQRPGRLGLCWALPWPAMRRALLFGTILSL